MNSDTVKAILQTDTWVVTILGVGASPAATNHKILTAVNVCSRNYVLAVPPSGWCDCISTVDCVPRRCFGFFPTAWSCWRACSTRCPECSSWRTWTAPISELAYFWRLTFIIIVRLTWLNYSTNNLTAKLILDSERSQFFDKNNFKKCSPEKRGKTAIVRLLQYQKFRPTIKNVEWKIKTWKLHQLLKLVVCVSIKNVETFRKMLGC